MSWSTRYLPPDPNQWRGRPDTPQDSSFFQIMQIMNLLEHPTFDTTHNTFALVGFRCDEGVRRNTGRIGAAEGPTAIRHALSRMPVQKKHFSCFDAGNITCADGDLEASQHALGAVVAYLLKHGVKPIILGGGQELAWGHYQGIARANPHRTLGIVNFDAHFDMRPMLAENKGSSGTPFLQIAKARASAELNFDYNVIGIQHAANIRQLFETAEAHQVQFMLADEIHLRQFEKSQDFIDRIVDQNDLIYMTVDMDVFSAASAPGVSASQPMGLSPWDVVPLIRQLAASGKVVSFDVSELAPRYDVDHRTAKLAATLIYEFIHHYQPKHW